MNTHNASNIVPTHKEQKSYFSPNVYKAALHLTGSFSPDPSLLPTYEAATIFTPPYRGGNWHTHCSISVTNQKALELGFE